MTFPWRRLIAPTVFFLLIAIPSSFAVPMTREQLFQLATVAAGDGEFDRAIELFQKVIELDPKFAPAYNGLGLVHQSFEQGDINEAIRYFKMAVELAPEYNEGWNNLGRAYYARALFIDAEKALLRSLELKPDQVDVQLALAWDYLLGQSRPDEAIAYFQKALPIKDEPMIYYGIGLAQLLKGDRFMVLDAVTQLRKRQQEDSASKLEMMVRENVRLTSKPGTPLVTGDPGQESLFDAQLKALEQGGFGSGGGSKEGIKVRLKGPLL
jgi:tetratricopeptide (TPR) repeat protein